MSVICDNCLIHLLNTIGFTMMGQAADRDTQKPFFIENVQLKFLTSYVVNRNGQTSESF